MENKELLEGFKEQFKVEPTHFITSGGRLEIVGNHTDHNHGLCVVGNCSLRIKAYVSKNALNKVRVFSVGHGYFEFNVSDLACKPEEYNTSLGLTKGIVFKVKENKHSVGGFDAYIDSQIPSGCGVSSSAAFEVLIGEILNTLYNNRTISNMELAKIGQFSEREYFNKPCGLLDQIGAAYKDCNYLDFKDIDNPVVEPLDFNLPVSIYLIASEGDHSELSHLYAEIPDGMRKIANMLGENFLRDTKEADFVDLVKNNKVDDTNALKKATHFYNENKNVIALTEAIRENNLELFFKAIKASQESSKNYLENTFVKGEYEESPQHIIDTVNEIDYMKSHGAIRIHGGGFKGSVIAFIENGYEDKFEEFLENRYKDRYMKVSIDKQGVTSELV